MLNSVLLYLEEEQQAQSVIHWGVKLAKQVKARVRGLTLVDTRASDDAHLSESAAYASLVNSHQLLAEHQKNQLRSDLSQACLKAKLDFDVRSIAGNPLNLLPQEARFHDLVVTAGFVGGDSAGLTSADLMDLVTRGVNPLLVLHPEQRAIERVLFVYDGSEAMGRAIRSYLSLGIMEKAQHRLLAIGENDQAARNALREMSDYCLVRRPHLETGFVVGKVRHVLLPYIKKWQADLAVIGMSRGNRLYRRLFGDCSVNILQQTSCALFAIA